MFDAGNTIQTGILIVAGASLLVTIAFFFVGMLFKRLDSDMKRLEHHLELLLERLDQDLKRIERHIEESEAEQSRKRAKLYERINEMFERLHKLELKIASHFKDDD